MFSTCGSSSRWVRRRTRPNGVMRGSSSLVHSFGVSPSGHARIVRNFRIEKTAPVPADPRLAVEERTAVRDEVADQHERQADGEQRRAPTDAEHDVEQALHPRVALAVQLADVEHQRHPLELTDRELAEPLLVEVGQRPDPHAGLVQHRGLVDDPRRRPAPSATARRRSRRSAIARSTSGSAPSSVPAASLDEQRATTCGRPLGRLVELGRERLVLVEPPPTTITRSRSSARSSSAGRDHACTARTRARARSPRRTPRTRGSSASRRRAAAVEIASAPTAARGDTRRPHVPAPAPGSGIPTAYAATQSRPRRRSPTRTGTNRGSRSS